MPGAAPFDDGGGDVVMAAGPARHSARLELHRAERHTGAGRQANDCAPVTHHTEKGKSRA